MLRAIVCSLILSLASSFSWFPIAKTTSNRLRYTSLQIRDGKSSLNMINEAGRNLKLEVQGGVISYDYVSSPSRTSSTSAAPVGIVYLPGLVRQRNEAKSINLQTLCRREDLYFLGADYFGVGRSSGQFSEGTIGRWTNDTIYLIDTVLNKRKTAGGPKEKLILVGHGMGAWISFLIALRRPDLVGGIVGLSADPDFTEELLWKGLSEEIKEKIMTDGSCEITWGKEKYPITRGLILDGRENLLLAGGPGSVKVRCPVRLAHALKDEEVSYQFSLRLLDCVASQDASLLLLKGEASHAMEGEAEFKAMRNMIMEVLQASKGGQFDLRSPGSG